MARVLSLSEAKAHLSRLVADCEKDEEECVITRKWAARGCSHKRRRV